MRSALLVAAFAALAAHARPLDGPGHNGQGHAHGLQNGHGPWNGHGPNHDAHAPKRCRVKHHGSEAAPVHSDAAPTESTWTEVAESSAPVVVPASTASATESEATPAPSEAAPAEEEAAEVTPTEEPAEVTPTDEAAEVTPTEEAAKSTPTPTEEAVDEAISSEAAPSEAASSDVASEVPAESEVPSETAASEAAPTETTPTEAAATEDAAAAPASTEDASAVVSETTPEPTVSAAEFIEAEPTISISETASATLEAEPSMSVSSAVPDNLTPAPTQEAKPINELAEGETTAFPDEILALHNNFRREYGAGELTWDEGLEQTAWAWAEKCIWEHSSDKGGENLAIGSFGDYGLEQLFNMWAGEAEVFNWAVPQYNGLYNAADNTFAVSGHFSAVVWKDTTKLGCAWTHCAPGTAGMSQASLYLVCHYNPVGNIYSVPIDPADPTVPDPNFVANVGPAV